MTLHHRLRAAAGNSGGGNWEILMATRENGHHSGSGSSQAFGYPGTTNFRSITASSTGANNRTGLQHGFGLYNAFFNKTGITKIALADWSKTWNPYSGGTQVLDPVLGFNRYVAYDLVSPTTKTIYQTILDLDTYNINNNSWANNDSPFGADSVDNFVAGNYESGNVYAYSTGAYQYSVTNGGYGVPDKFVIWGINRDSDNDTQVLCAYNGNLQSGKGDQWRGSTPHTSFFSYWGNDWHSDSRYQTISQSSQTDPGHYGQGIGTGDTIYLLAA